MVTSENDEVKESYIHSVDFQSSIPPTFPAKRF